MIRCFMRQWADAVEGESTFLLDGRHAKLRGYHIDRVYRIVEDLRGQLRQVSRQQQSHLRQIEITLGSLQEAVLLVNDRNEIVVANQSAQDLLSKNESLHGKLIESVVSSSGFLEYARKVREGTLHLRQEVALHRESGMMVFEVASGLVPTGEEGKDLLLFVLHDISQLKRLERIRKDFVANVSHELRTPVTIMKGYADSLASDYDQLDEAMRKRFVDKMCKSADRMHVLLEDLLALSRLETSEEVLHREKLSLHALIEEIVDDYGLRFAEGGQKVLFEFDQRVDRVPADEIKLAQVLQNLLDNVLSYAKGFSQVVIRTELNGDQVVVSISDDGCGIPAADVERIFERFYRVDKGRSREQGGTGLGLSIVKHIIQLHKGSVWATSAAGKGATISFALPLA